MTRLPPLARFARPLSRVALAATLLATGCSSPMVPEARAPLSSPSPSSVSGGSAFVHLAAKPAVSLQMLGRSEEDAGTWVTVCDAPCDSEAPLDAVYRLHGGGLDEGETFVLRAGPGGRVTITPEDGTGGRRAAGGVLIGLGAAAVTGGLILQVVSHAMSSNDLLPGGEHASSSSDNTGAAIAGAGLAGVVLGVVLVATSHPAGVEQSGVAPRAPVWREPDSFAKNAPKPTTMPLFSATF